MRESVFLSRFAGMFKPPFAGLAILLWIYYVWCFLIYPHSPILNGKLPDTDDYMYLVQVMDWLKGQNWFDNIQHRMDPPAGALIPFSRLVALPLAGFIALLRPLLGDIGAGLVTAALVPLIYLAFLFSALRWTAAAFMDQSWSRLTALVAFFSSALMFQFIPGHIDHHGLHAVVMALALGAAARMIREPAGIIWPLIGGLALGFGQLISLEILPCLVLLIGWMGLWAMAEGGKAARSAFIMAAVYALSSAIFLATVHPPSRYLEIDMINFSFVYVVFACCVALCFAGIAFAACTPFKYVRYATGAGLAVASGVLFLACFPQLAAGPYTAMDAKIAHMFFTYFSESMPIAIPEKEWWEIYLAALEPLLATVFAAIFYLRAQGAGRWLWGLLLFLCGVGTSLALFYQTRFLVFADLFSVIPFTAFLQHSLGYARMKLSGRSLWTAQLALVLLIIPVPLLFLPALADGRPFNTGIFMFMVPENHDQCPAGILSQMLDEPLLYGKRPYVIMNSIDQGPEILFRTPHKVLGAPYHTNVNGNLDVLEFFTAHDPDAAKAVAQRRGAELVVLCGEVGSLYRTSPQNQVTIGDNGRTILDPGASFAEQLAAGRIPSWLKPVRFPTLGNIMLFEVRLAPKD